MNLRERLSTQHLSCIKDGRLHSFQGLSKVIWLSFVFIIALSFRTNGPWKERVGICWLCRPILWSQRLASIASVKSNIALQIFALFSCNWEGSGDIHFGVLWFPDQLKECHAAVDTNMLSEQVCNQQLRKCFPQFGLYNEHTQQSLRSHCAPCSQVCVGGFFQILSDIRFILGRILISICDTAGRNHCGLITAKMS